MILKTKRKKFKEITAIKINGQIIDQVKCTTFRSQCGWWTLLERSCRSSCNKNIENDSNYGKGETLSVYPNVIKDNL